MTIENKLKALILDRYKSIREFTQSIDMPYSTLDSVLKRGIGNSSVTNIIKICQALRISVDALADGKIAPIEPRRIEIELIEDPIDLTDIFSDTKARLAHPQNLTLDGRPVDDETAKAIAQGIDVSLELAKRQIKKS